MKRQLSALILLTAFVSIISSCMNDEDIEYKRAFTAGAVVYQNHCQNCHGNTGEGLSALMPPLTDSVYLKQNKAQLACILKYGLAGKLIIVHNKPYQNQMPPSDLAPIEIAQVLTYVKNSFGNKLGGVKVEEVNKDLSICQ
ncbi:c-type cytochrome [Mucilaginibacter jinjuensis]|uniref:C-type cytochrome n=1 Tax=Mucilaginibacter jinjuensis TaxID=1176721 RepID=A0ABY7TIK6_9SPHI|nr:c-type cytochrome [Mucilaginibacter jinjuensis]WCT14992.1 c-type cytochrome [Mucilaginibacter jinjuensis]